METTQGASSDAKHFCLEPYAVVAHSAGRCSVHGSECGSANSSGVCIVPVLPSGELLVGLTFLRQGSSDPLSVIYAGTLTNLWNSCLRILFFDCHPATYRWFSFRCFPLHSGGFGLSTTVPCAVPVRLGQRRHHVPDLSLLGQLRVCNHERCSLQEPRRRLHFHDVPGAAGVRSGQPCDPRVLVGLHGFLRLQRRYWFCSPCHILKTPCLLEFKSSPHLMYL